MARSVVQVPQQVEVVGSATSKSSVGMAYVVRTGPITVITVVSDQAEIHKCDCVSVQQSGNKANIKRLTHVSSLQ